MGICKKQAKLQVEIEQGNKPSADNRGLTLNLGKSWRCFGHNPNAASSWQQTEINLCKWRRGEGTR
jgi:hypothetical protein